MRCPRLIVFTDLDGTLLDHDTYSFAAARPALDALHGLQIPVVLATSKTLSETAATNRRLDNAHPFIFENGGGIAIPAGYFPGMDGAGPQRVIRLGRPYAEIVTVVNRLRDTLGCRLTGFHDWDARTVAARTGLALADAERAKLRTATLPIEWRDTADALEHFRRALAEHELYCVEGGRFLHIQGDCTKGAAMGRLTEMFDRQASTSALTIALGDSPNDRDMLMAADVAVVVRNPHRGILMLAGHADALFPSPAGPAGWNAAIFNLLGRFCTGET